MSHAAEPDARTRVDPQTFVDGVLELAASLDALPPGTITPHLADDAFVLLNDRAALAREVSFRPLTPKESADFRKMIPKPRARRNRRAPEPGPEPEQFHPGWSMEPVHPGSLS